MPLYGSGFISRTANQIISGIKNFTQNLGLGISTPQAKLHIDGGDATGSTIKFTAGNVTGQLDTDGFDIGISAAASAFINQRESLPLNLGTNNATRLSISGGGLISVTSTQQSTTSSSGALVLSGGGLGVAGNINAGGTFASNGFATIGSITNINFVQMGVVTGSNRIGIAVRGNASQANNLQEWRNSTDTVLSSVSPEGVITAPQFRLSALNTAPASSGATGTTGEIRIDANFIYLCIATNTWRRAALSTW